jgi:outer membrane receptor protein involved in Fe transport
VKTTYDQPTESDNHGVSLNASKGLNFWSATLRVNGTYAESRGEQLIQDEILEYRSQGYSAGSSINMTPFSFLGLNYSFSWSQNKSYTVERPERFIPIRGTSQNVQINIFPTKTLTINISAEHQYNSAINDGNRYTSFADVGVKFKRKNLDLELEFNNIFNTKQYISASYSDISTYYYTYNLRPASVLLRARFKLK